MSSKANNALWMSI